MKPVYYSQKDKKWSSIPYTIDGDKNETIGASGCGPTCMAMILAAWINPKITPVETCKMAIEMKDRTANNGTEWEFFKHVADRYGLKFKQTSSTDETVKALQENALVVCSMGRGYFTQHGHYILAYEYRNGNIYVNDPASTTRTSGTVQLFKAQSKQYFIFYKPLSAYEEALNVINKAIGIDVDYWKDRKDIDPHFDDLIIKIAKAQKG
jgi:ABC-type bacteriocin/lantibiotic exporter with double-glycine peptidase domain